MHYELKVLTNGMGKQTFIATILKIIIIIKATFDVFIVTS